MNICDVFHYYARKQPEHAALIEGARTIRYGELNSLIDRMATRLIGLGLRPGDCVGCALRDDADHIIALLGILRAGLVFLPLDWRAPPVERANLASRFSAALVLVPDGTPALPVPTQVINEDWHNATTTATPLDLTTDRNDRAGIIGLSSGTTGEPSGVSQSHRTLFFQANSRWNSLQPLRPRRCFAALPLFFTAGRHMVMDHLVFGATAIIYPPLFSADEFVEQVTRHQATITFMVPTVVRWLIDLPTKEPCLMPGLDALIIGAAPSLAEEKLAALDHISPNAHDSFGATGGGWMSLAKPEHIKKHPDSVGLPTFLVERQIVDESGNQVDPGEVGRFRCRGPGVVGTGNGEDEWHYTGDLAAENEDGYLFLKGRAADLIICGGANVLPEEVERALLKHPNVAEAAVVGRPSQVYGEEVAAFVILRQAGTTSDELQKLCRSTLAPYKVPSIIITLDHFPLTTSGKVKKRELVHQLAPSD